MLKSIKDVWNYADDYVPQVPGKSILKLGIMVYVGVVYAYIKIASR